MAVPVKIMLISSDRDKLLIFQKFFIKFDSKRSISQDLASQIHASTTLLFPIMNTSQEKVTQKKGSHKRRLNMNRTSKTERGAQTCLWPLV